MKRFTAFKYSVCNQKWITHFLLTFDLSIKKNAKKKGNLQISVFMYKYITSTFLNWFYN